MKNITIQTILIFIFLYIVSILLIPSLDVVLKESTAQLNYKASIRVIVFSVLSFAYFLIKSKVKKFQEVIKIRLVLLTIAAILIIDLVSWYFIGIYKYEGVSNFVFIYLLTLPVVGGFALFVSAYIAEVVSKKVNVH